jgi:hypothetical protein
MVLNMPGVILMKSHSWLQVFCFRPWQPVLGWHGIKLQKGAKTIPGLR